MLAASWLGFLFAQTTAPAPAPAAARGGRPVVVPNPELPSLLVIGDSTAAPGGGQIQGWAEPFRTYFDPTKINAINVAVGGRSTRTYMSEDHYQQVLNVIKPGDMVLVQLGHNDVFAINDATRARGTLHGIGEETQEIDNMLTKKHEVVHTYGWYLRQIISDIKAKGGSPIMVTLTVRDRWNDDGTIERLPAKDLDLSDTNRFSAPPMYSIWTAQVAKAGNLPLLDVHNMIADHDDKLGKAVVDTYYNSPADPTHRNVTGATVDAESTLACLRTLKGPAFDAFLSDKGKAIAPADAKYVVPNTPATAK